MPMVGDEVGLLTAKPTDVAQVLSPAALTMQALSIWPVPTRLVWRVSHMDSISQYIYHLGRHLMPYLEST